MRYKILLISLMAGFFFLALNANAQTVLPLNGSASGSITIPGDTATYSLTTNADGLINLTLTVSNGQNTYVSLYDSDHVTLLVSPNYTSNGPLTISADGLAQGKYFVKVYPYATSGTPNFTISNSLIVAAPANDIEPNNTLAQAEVLPFNGSTTGHVGYYYNHYKDTADWYKVTTNADGLLRIRLNITNGLAIYCTVYDHDGVTVFGSNYTRTTLDINTDGLAAGTYYVKIYGYDYNQFSPYTLSDSLFTPGIGSDIEPNNTPSQASLLNLDDSTTGHVGYYYNHYRDTADWYKLTTNADGLLRLRLKVTDNQPIYFTLYDHDGVTALGTKYTYTTDEFNTDGLAAGTYYVKIFGYDYNQFAPYTLLDSLFTPGISNDIEPNNTPAQADVLPFNGSTTGHVGYYYNHYRDTADWYKLTTNADGLLRLRLKVTDNQPIYFTLYDHDGVTALGTKYTYTTDEFNTDGLAAGTYYVKIYGYDYNQFAPYTLLDSLFTYNPNDPEPNNVAYQAATIPANRTVTGHVGFYYNNYRDTTDFWKINYTGTSGNLNLTFNLLPLNLGGSTNPTYFQVYADTNAAPIYNQYTYNNLVANLTGLTQGYYYIKVFEYTNSQFNAYSITNSFTQVNIANISLLKSGSSVTNCGSDTLVYTLSASHSPYTVRLYRDGVKVDSLTTNSTATFTGLNDGNYYATVYGDGATDLAFSQSLTTTFLPPAPAGLTTSNIGVHTARLNWSPFGCVTNYRVHYKVTGSSTWTTLQPPTDSTTYTLLSLSPYTKYTWQVASLDSADGLMSAYSDTAIFKTLSDTAHIALLHAGIGSICSSDTLKYISSNSAMPYNVQLYRDGVVYGSTISVNDTATFSGLPPGNYYATATGTGSGGSLGTSGNTLLSPPIPTGLDSTNVTTSTATLHWSSISCTSYYTVEYRLTGDVTWTSVNTAKDSAALSGLTTDTVYVWQVASVDTANGQFIMSAYSVKDTFRTQQALPVTLINFDGILQNGNALLRWSTATEINNKGFELQKSVNSQVFTDIGFVPGYGNSSLVHNYKYTDEKVLSGSNYYRLKQIDFDGRVTYSSVIKLDYAKFAWNVLGNPVSNNSWLQLQMDKSANVIVQIVSINGSVIQSINKGKIAAGTYSIPLHLNNVSSGIYVVRLIVDGRGYSKEIIK